MTTLTIFQNSLKLSHVRLHVIHIRALMRQRAKRRSIRILLYMTIISTSIWKRKVNSLLWLELSITVSTWMALTTSGGSSRALTCHKRSSTLAPSRWNALSFSSIQLKRSKLALDSIFRQFCSNKATSKSIKGWQSSLTLSWVTKYLSR